MKTFQKIMLFSAVVFLGCQRELLDAKPDKSLVVPTQLEDFKALLENTALFSRSPGLQEIASDDLYTTNAGWNNLRNNIERQTYIWGDDIYEGKYVDDWTEPYEQIFYANIVLKGLAELDDSKSSLKEELKGRALFFRGYALFGLSMLFAAQYDSQMARNLPGVPAPLSSNVNDRPGRKTLDYTYSQILADLHEAETLLPSTSNYKTHPNQIVVQAILARVYLTMSDYENASSYAAKVIHSDRSLMDYNTLDISADRPFPTLIAGNNPEVLYNSVMPTYSYFRELSSGATSVSQDLFALYDEDDLRKAIYFIVRENGNIHFKGTYSGNSTLLSSPALDEMYLIYAESQVRLGNQQAGMDKLNQLLATRFKVVNGRSTFVHYPVEDQASNLMVVLEERRKSLVARGIRWYDLKRLNGDEKLQTTISRTVEGKQYTLLPGSPRYVFPIPDAELALTGDEQNPR